MYTVANSLYSFSIQISRIAIINVTTMTIEKEIIKKWNWKLHNARKRDIIKVGDMDEQK